MPGSPAFNLGYAFTAILSLALIPGWAIYDMILLYPAVLLVVQQRNHLPEYGRLLRFLYIAILNLLAWPWIAATVLVVIYLLSPGGSNALIDQYWRAPWITTLFPALLLVPLVTLAYYGAHPQAPITIPQVRSFLLKES